MSYPHARTAAARAIALGAATAVTLSLGLVALATPASAATTATVTPESTDWGASDVRPGASLAYSTEFGAAAGLGTSALKMETTTANGKAMYLTAQDAGLPLSTIEESVGYSTYRSSASTGQPFQVPSLQMASDTNGAAEGGFTTFVFEPTVSPSTAAVMPELPLPSEKP